MDYDHVIFDLDGTLTLAVHDFPAIKRELGLRPDIGILESLRELPASDAAQVRVRLDALEADLARQARPAAGAPELLDELARRRVRVGILTRNTKDNALATLAGAGLDGFFEPRFVLGRYCAAPKPDPDGVLSLLKLWDTPPTSAVMIGDYLHDLRAGKAAGTSTVLVHPGGISPWPEFTDRCVAALDELCDTDAP